MTDEEIRSVIAELDCALEIMRKNRGADFDASDLKIRTLLADLRRELAVYRALSQAAEKQGNS